LYLLNPHLQKKIKVSHLPAPEDKLYPKLQSNLHFFHTNLSNASAVNPKVSLQNSLPSSDQIAAEMIGKDTPFPSLSIAAIDKTGLKGGNCPGMRSLSWNKEGRHISGIQGAVGLYKLLYGNKSLNKMCLPLQMCCRVSNTRQIHESALSTE